jgi:hypothetical protein
MDEQVNPGADRLDGCGQIAEFYYGEDNKKNRDKVYYNFASKILPLGKEGSIIVGSKVRLRKHYADVTGAGQ